MHELYKDAMIADTQVKSQQEASIARLTTMSAQYLSANFQVMTQRQLTHSIVAGLWMHILGTYYKVDDAFLVKPEGRLPHRPNESVDEMVVLMNLAGGRDSTCIVLEVKPEGSSETWENARAQAFGYITEGLRKRLHKTIAIVARGRQFVMFEVPGSQVDSIAPWVNLGLNNDGTQHPLGTPYDIVEHADHLQEELLKIRAEAMRGAFEDS